MKALLWYLPAVGWAAGVLLVGALPASSLPSSGQPLDKLAHLLMYGGLGALLAWGRARARRPAWGWLVAVAVLVGMADELHQRVTPGRTAEIGDLMADAAGILLGFGAMGWRARWRRGERTQRAELRPDEEASGA